MPQHAQSYQHFIRKAMPDDRYPDCFNLKLVKSIDELKSIISVPTNFMSFDTETNGLNPETNFIVGYSFCLDGKSAYYVAVNHAVGDCNLGTEALDLIYSKMVCTKEVLMYNMRFDCRMMEWYGYIDSPLTFEERLNKPFFRYDMSRVNVVDIQAIVYLADTNIKYPSLKWAEGWFLGWKGATFEETLDGAENFYYLDPNECYTYAATDALGTFLLYPKVYPFLQEAKTSGNLDVKCLYPLMKYENETIKIDTDMLKSYSNELERGMTEVEKRCWAIAGYPFNISSNKDKNLVLDRLGISTGGRTKSGDWQTGKDAIEVTLKNMDPTDPNKKFLTDLTEYAALKKQRTSYVDNIIEMCENAKHPGRLRFSYKTVEVPTGRLAAGGDKKNDFFANLNIQNITKPHKQDWYYLPWEKVKEIFPGVEEASVDANGNEKRDFEYTLRDITSDGVQKETKYRLSKILDWCFADSPYNVEGECVIEGFSQHMNIRSAFMPDDGRYWVSIDFAAQELRIATIVSGEPVWKDAFIHGKDPHKQTAIAIWGAENYTKDKRKQAKGANFGILYGQTEYNFSEMYNMTIDEARAFIEKFKQTLPTLFKWISGHEFAGQKTGSVYTYFGRPRRVKFWFDSPEYGLRNFARRTCVNTTIQGTGADILKISFIKLFQTIFKNTENSKKVKFLATIHDEINFQVTKEDTRDIIPILISCMRLQLPNWEFPIDVGLEIGNRWGCTFAFKFDPQTYQVLEPAGDLYAPKPKEEKKVVEVIEEVKDEIPEISFDMEV